MNKEEYINHNITLTFDFIREAVKDPSVLDNIENGSTIEFVEKDRPIPKSQKTTQPDRYFKVKHRFEKADKKSLHAGNSK